MQLVEQHVIRKGDSRYEEIDRACFASKNLYNLAMYTVRQAFFRDESNYLNWCAVDKILQSSDAYQALPAKVSQQVLKQVHETWISFFAALKVWKVNPGAFTGRPRLPGYKEKQSGRNVLIYTDQAFSKKSLKDGIIQPSKLNIAVNTKQTRINQVRIIPRSKFYVVEVVYTVEPIQAELDAGLVAGIDIGLNNLATLTSNKPGFRPVIVNGRPLKSLNQFYNKRKAELQARLPEGQYTSNQIQYLTIKRNWRMRHYLHTASRRIVELLVKERVATLIVGKNSGWKQDINLGKKTNQNFVSVPHAQFIDMLKYKCQLVGIEIIIHEESYTSKCSFLDLEPIQKHETYQGKRISRGMFCSSTGEKINADVNGSYNIIRKVIPNAFIEGIAELVVAPVRLSLQTKIVSLCGS
jgi:putative transposase